MNDEPAALSEMPYDGVAVPRPLPDGWSVGVAPQRHRRAAELIEYSVFVESGFCEPNEAERVLEYDAWREQCEFQVVVSDTDEVTAVVRTIVGRYEDLPVGKFARDEQRPPDPVLEYASLAIPASNRRQGQAEELYRAVFVEGVRHGVGGLVAIAEDWLLRLLQQGFDLPFTRLGPSKWYMGGDCFAIGMDMHETFRHLAVRQPSFLGWVLSEIDLRDIPSPDLRGTVASVAAG